MIGTHKGQQQQILLVWRELSMWISKTLYLMETSWWLSQKKDFCQTKRTNRGFMTIWKYFFWRKKFYPNKPLKIQTDLLSIWRWTMKEISWNLLKVKLQVYLFSSSSFLEPSICQMSLGRKICDDKLRSFGISTMFTTSLGVYKSTLLFDHAFSGCNCAPYRHRK